MSTSDDDAGFGRQLLRGLGASTRHNALAYGFSLGLTGSFGILDVAAGKPDPADILLFGIGGSLTFTIAIAVTTQGYRRAVREQPREVRVVGSSLSFFSVVGSIGVAWLCAWLFSGWPVWFLGAFGASAAYLALSAVELSLARLVWPILPHDRIEDPED